MLLKGTTQQNVVLVLRTPLWKNSRQKKWHKENKNTETRPNNKTVNDTVYVTDKSNRLFLEKEGNACKENIVSGNKFNNSIESKQVPVIC